VTSPFRTDRDVSAPRRTWRLLRFLLASILATLTSAVVFPLVYQGLDAHPSVASLVAFGAGTVVSFTVARFYAWNRRDRHRLGRDVVAYALVTSVIGTIAAIVTTYADSRAAHTGLSATEKTVVVEAAYLGTFAVMFVAKFAVLDRLVFRARNTQHANSGGNP
jgi:putative flippase GtrA